MNRLIEGGMLRQIPCGTNFAYVLTDPALFQATDYKVLHAQMDGGFLRCMRMLYNGQVMLSYLTDGLKPLSVLLPGLNAESFLAIAESLIRDVLDIRSNGFLFCGNVELSFDRIFVDTNTMQVRLVYLPLSRHLFDDENAFESFLRSELLRAIHLTPELTGPRIAALAVDLMDGTLSLEDLHSRMNGGTVAESPARQPEPPVMPGKPEAPKEASQMWLVSMNAPKKVKFRVDRDRFLIGKRGAAVDAGIDFNKLISRIHCRIDASEGNYTVTDLGSTNGTYLNGNRLNPNTAYPVKHEDILRLANSMFQIQIR